MRSFKPATIVLTALGFAGLAVAQTGVNPGNDDLGEPERIYSPYVERTATDADFAEGVYSGDIHLHSSYSTDAGMIGNKLPPEQAYRFARGEDLITSTGQRARVGKIFVKEKSSWNFYVEYQTSLYKSDWSGSAVDNSFRINATYTIPVG